ncbi:unnamed protein product [Dracunculus medinensis]|uniref:Uncharacterized protein n=1 Tax=Dracunculus medinensis TaxID=318479 RepID=A0A3P7SZY7_DRAME|nr:unnamed protein product [Dracunculus medinensis]
MLALKERNKALEQQVELLKKQLREKERIENQLKRKILENEAEIRIWRTKCELRKLPTFTICNPTKNHNGNNNNKTNINDEPGLSTDLMDQLNIAADKLSRLSAVKDLKLLQSEMETALKEISEK